MTVPGCFDVTAQYYGKRGAGIYRRLVVAGGLVKLSIDGLGLSGKVFWDGKEIGTCKYAYMTEGFVFDAGIPGEHELMILVDNRHNDVFFPFFDFYGYGGIYGDVQLEELPIAHLERIQVCTSDYKTGEIKLRVVASQDMAPSSTVKIRFDNGQEIEKEFSGREKTYILRVPEFKLWSPATPFLHKVTVSLGTDEVTENFGVREIQIEGTRLLLNGAELRLMGYNRHESHPQFGAASPPALIAADLQLIKQQGCNFVRGSHYPQRRTLLELCDRIGILVWEETLGWDVKPPDLFKPEFLQQQVEQARKMVANSFNHPCIIIWGFLNETESQMPELRPIIERLYQTVRAEDDTRLITYASNKYEKDCCLDLVDIIAMNPYPGWGDANWETVCDVANVKPRLEKLIAALPQDKPFMISETGGAALYGVHDPYCARWSEEYQAKLLTESYSRILDNPRFCGLAVWQFCDAKSYINGHVLGRPRGFNNKGVLDEYRRPKMAWKELKDSIIKKPYLQNK
jgi:beta-glucuronidase